MRNTSTKFWNKYTYHAQAGFCAVLCIHACTPVCVYLPVEETTECIQLPYIVKSCGH